MEKETQEVGGWSSQNRKDQGGKTKDTGMYLRYRIEE